MKRKLISIFLTVIMVLTMVPNTIIFSSAAAVESGSCGENVTYELSQDGVLTITGTGNMYDYSFSASSVSPFYSNTNIKKVVINEGVTSIGSYAFYYSTQLISVAIPDSVNSIGNNAFSACFRLTSVIIPPSVTSIGKHTFDGCESLTSVTIPDSVNSICEYAFSGCRSLTSVSIPSSVNTLNKFAFYGCYSLTAINVDSANTVYSSDDGVLINKENGTLMLCPEGKTGSYSIPSTVTSIGERAFSGCSDLTSVIIPGSVTSIGNNAFKYCSSLTSVTIPDSVISIGEYAFENCDKLTSATIPSSVISIGSYAFDCCKDLTTVTISDSVKSIGRSAFNGCSKLTAVNVDSANTVYSSDDGVLINKEKKQLIFCPEGKTGSYSIPSTVTSIGEYAFDSCKGLTSVAIPSSVTSIGDSAFRICSGLTSVTIPDSVTSIGSEAFSSCAGLTSVRLPDSDVSIGYSAFSYCSGLTSVTIPDSVVSIGNNVFGYCDNISEVHINDLAAWCNKELDCNLEPLSNGAKLYINDVEVKDITIPDSVTSFKGTIFQGYSGLTSVTIPSKVTSILNSAFNGCKNLTVFNVDSANTVYCSDNGVLLSKDTKELILCPPGKAGSYSIPSTVNSIGDGAFKDCNKLTSVTIPDSVASIGANAFENCYGLVSLILPEGITDINSSVFYGCSGLTYVDIPSTVTSIGFSSFEDCSDLTQVNLPSGLTTVSGFAFSGCSKLTWVSIPDSVTTIDENAFGYENYIDRLENFIIYGNPGTAAETYASENGFTLLPPCGHLNTQASEEIPAGCKNGYTAGVFCNDCGKWISGHNIIPALGHSWDEGTITAEPTPTAIGEKTYTCSVCGEKRTELIHYDESSLTDSGKCGDDIIYKFYSDGTLILNGTGATYGYSPRWPADFVSNCNIKNVFINDGITSLGDYLFINCPFDSVLVPRSVSSIGYKAIGYYNDGIMPEGKYKNLVIYSYTGTAAETYASENDITFKIYCKHLNTENSAEVPASCTESGFTAGTFCKDCKEWISGHDTIPALGHDIAVIPYKAPTCTEEGSNEYYKCNRCGLYFRKGTPADSDITGKLSADFTSCKINGQKVNPHYEFIYDGTQASAPGFIFDTVKQGNSVTVNVYAKELPELENANITFRYPQVLLTVASVTDGADAKICIEAGDNSLLSSCNDREPGLIYFSFIFYSKLGNDTEDKNVNAAYFQLFTINFNLNAPEYISIDAESELIPATGHNLGAWTENADGTHTRHCENKDCIYSETENCTFTEWTVTKDPTCIEKGSKERTCTVCGYKETAEIPAAGHKFSDWVITEATYMSEGKKERTCTVCGKTETEPIPRLQAEKEIKTEDGKISLKHDNNVLKADVKLNAEEKSKGGAFDIVSKEKGKFSKQLYDITLTDSKGKVQPKGFVLVCIPLPEGYNAENTVVYYVSEEDSSLVKMNSYVKDGVVCFETDHFSSYAIVDESSHPGDADGDGKITAADARHVLRASVGLEEKTEGLKNIADMDKDGKITAADARIILRKSVGLE